MNRDDLPAIVQAALVHAQFETIHPFADGNGRVGRALIHVVLKRRQATPRVVPPVSLVLAPNANRYIEGLNGFRTGEPFAWCSFFTRVLQASVEHAEHLRVELEALKEGWMKAAGNPRSHSAAARLIQNLPAQPVLDLTSAIALVGGSDEAIRKALNDLTDAGVLVPVTVGKKRNRVWEARELLNVVDKFEWDLATPTKPVDLLPNPITTTRNFGCANGKGSKAPDGLRVRRLPPLVQWSPTNRRKPAALGQRQP